VASTEELNELVKTWWKTESFGCNYDIDEWQLKEDKLILESHERTTCKVDRKKQSEQEFSEPTPHVWYPHHYPVLNPHKPGKVHRVSNAAAKYQDIS